ncbi:MAG: hypothetical protein OSA99_01320 [Acidimicrobiales bacterium]|nr:hypothetical protein [Acidimicrobiales bacterium]
MPARAPSPVAAPAGVAVPAQVDSLEIDAVTTYRLDPDVGAVQVTVVATLTNTAPSRRRGNIIETPFYDSFGAAAIGPVANASAEREGTALSTTIETGDSAVVEFVVVDLSPNLVFGTPQTITVRYDIPAQPSRSDFATRINDAFASWYAVGTGSNGAIDLVVDVPERFEVEFTDIVVPAADVADGRAVYRFDDLDEADAFAGVSARDDAALVKKSTTVDDDDFEIQAWPGDDEWADFAVDAVDRGVLELVERTGLPLAGERSIAIAETATPYLYGYAGWFLPEEDRIEIGDELDLQVMLHELAHLWFNGDLFDSRWINEGLAEVASNDIAGSFDVPTVDVVPIDPNAPGAQPLNVWVSPGADEDAAAIEDYGYATSYAVMQALVDDIGDDGLQALLAHADAGLIPYVGDPDPEASFGASDWRYLYDIADRVIGSARVVELFDAHVLSDDDRVQVTTRSGLTERYDALADAGGALSPPLEVRRRMASWSFDRAATAMDEAAALLADIHALSADLDERSIAVPAALETSYESAKDLDETTALLAEVTEVAPAVAEADAAADDLDPVEWLGLVGTDIGGRRDATLASFDDGDTEAAARRAAAVVSSIDDAPVVAAARLVAVLFLAGAATAAVRQLRQIRRSRHRRSSSAL